MKTNIKIISLKLTNFKGIKGITIPFNENGETTISGRNATGKSTLFDAFTWLLFGKDSSDRKDFEIKPILNDGTHLHKADYEVTAMLEVNLQEVTLRRVLNEKWVKRRGSEESEFTGHETSFFVNDVPYSQKEYQEYISGLIPESSFKLVTNPYYFNSLKKEQRREMLLSFAGKIDEQQIVEDNNDLKGLLHLMQTSMKTLEQLKKEYAAKKKRLNEEISQIPARISEVERSAQAFTLPDLSAEEAQLQELTNKVEALSDLHANAEREFSAKREEIARIEKQILQLEFKHRAFASEANQKRADKIAKLTDAINDIQRTIASKERNIDALTDEKKRGEEDIVKLRAKFMEESAKQFHMNGELICPTCKQELPDAETKAVELQRNFNENKAKVIQEINIKGQSLRKQMEQGYDTSIMSNREQVLELKANLTQLLADLKEASAIKLVDELILINKDFEIAGLKTALTALLNHDAKTQGNSLVDELKAIEAQRETILKKIAECESLQANIETANKRIDELKKQQKTMSSELASIEKTEFIIERYKKRHDEILETRINNKFELVTFRMYEDQINGGQQETCETLVNGVPFSDANHAAQINAGIDICNTFSKQLEVNAPIWVDNAEAVNRVLPSESQLIKLVVTTDESLTIN